jgi:TonB family protein
MQGISANSFLPGAGTGLNVRAGTTVQTAATDQTMSLQDAAGARSYASVATPPKVKLRAQMEVPEEAQKAGVQGDVKVLLDIGPDGTVTGVKVLVDLGFGTGEACADAWRRSRFSPGKQGETPVAVLGVPQLCQVIELK